MKPREEAQEVEEGKKPQRDGQLESAGMRMRLKLGTSCLPEQVAVGGLPAELRRHLEPST